MTTSCRAPYLWLRCALTTHPTSHLVTHLTTHLTTRLTTHPIDFVEKSFSLTEIGLVLNSYGLPACTPLYSHSFPAVCHDTCLSVLLFQVDQSLLSVRVRNSKHTDVIVARAC